jgi:hypothetical protein
MANNRKWQCARIMLILTFPLWIIPVMVWRMASDITDHVMDSW